jgi:hypothetical protein
MLILPAEDIDSVYGVNPLVGPDSVIPWRFDWGLWLVNATPQLQAYNLGPSQSLLLATPNEGAELDLGSPDPLIGDWTLTPLTSPLIGLDPFSYLVLVEPTAEPIPGDYNADDVVDAADYTVWRHTLGSMTDLRADGDNSGTVDQADYGVWTANFGVTAAVVAANSLAGRGSVPEPRTVVPFSLALLAFLAAPRRHQGRGPQSSFAS